MDKDQKLQLAYIVGAILAAGQIIAEHDSWKDEHGGTTLDDQYIYDTLVQHQETVLKMIESED